jgi:general secretion pathway protein G
VGVTDFGCGTYNLKHGVIGMKRILRLLQIEQERTAQKGFSLIELLIVMVILGLLASLVGPKMFGKLGMAKQKTAKTQIEMLMTAMDSYRLDVGKYPSSQEGIDALVDNSGSDKWEGPYLQKGVPKDPWDNDYQYNNPGEHGEIDIFSYGADGQSGGDGENTDVGSWQ